MLNPPLSLLPFDLFAYIVDHIAKLPFSNEHLYNLSFVDRVFTQLCQAYIFKDLHLGYGRGTKSRISNKLETMRKILSDEPSFANRVRVVTLSISHKRNGWLFNDFTFITIVQLLAKSPMPPHKLHLSGITCSFIFDGPILVAGRLMQSFFSETLTILHLTQCRNVPLTLFLICPRLREIYMDHVEVTEDNYDKYPDQQCSGRELPAPEYLSYRNSESLIKFHTGVVVWSKLRVLKLCPHEEKEMARLQPILDIACNTLEELHLTRFAWGTNVKQLPLAGLVNLRDIPCLRVFALHAIIECDAQEFVVFRDIKLVLNTIPTSNKVTNLSFGFTIAGEHPFDGCFKEDWVGIWGEVVRISAGKPLELNLRTVVRPPNFQYPPHRQDELFERITEKIASLLNYPNIDTHYTHP
ncbi:hypothetical protein BYT27DRAFT_7236317 [Phlegmacium glaucopus]|nr:hypothetical protein BYT27DRAFT_7236317 [Phlegmacium glaucopus]